MQNDRFTKEKNRMKFTTIALGLVLVGATSVSAAPYYIGENLTPSNNVTLGFWDTPTKKDTAGTITRGDTGNIAAFNLDGVYLPVDNVSLGVGFPFFIATKNATATGTKRNSIGNVSLNGGWNKALTTSDNVWTYGYSLSGEVYLPSSRKNEGSHVALANPTTDYYRFSTKATSVIPTVGAFISRDMFSVKGNFGYGYVYQTGQTDKNRNTMIGQVAASWHALPNLHTNLEYNSIALDSSSRRGTETARYSHSLTPSLSGNYENILGQVFATVPLDKNTRRYTNVAFGLNTGYTF